VDMAANDYIYMQAYQTSGNPLNLTVASLTVIKLDAAQGTQGNQGIPGGMAANIVGSDLSINDYYSMFVGDYLEISANIALTIGVESVVEVG
jgi:hypothetical protein